MMPVSLLAEPETPFVENHGTDTRVQPQVSGITGFSRGRGKARLPSKTL